MDWFHILSPVYPGGTEGWTGSTKFHRSILEVRKDGLVPQSFNASVCLSQKINSSDLSNYRTTPVYELDARVKTVEYISTHWYITSSFKSTSVLAVLDANAQNAAQITSTMVNNNRRPKTAQPKRIVRGFLLILILILLNQRFDEKTSDNTMSVSQKYTTINRTKNVGIAIFSYDQVDIR